MVFGAARHDRVTNSFSLVVRTALHPVHIPVQCQFGLIVERKILFWCDVSLLLHPPPSLSRASAVILMRLDDVSLLLHLSALFQ